MANSLEVTVLQANKSAPRAAVMLCHGFGAPGDDLVSLHGELVERRRELADVRFYFPAAPLSLSGMGYGDSRAWWMIDTATVARLGAGDQEALRAFRSVEPQGMAEARALLLGAVKQVLADAKVPASKLVLGGFSQGAMLTTDVALRLEQSPAGLAIMSGTLLIEEEWTRLARARPTLPVFQSHGRQDPLLAYFTAEWLRDVLRQCGLNVNFLPFDGGHTITLEVVEQLATFLSERLSG